MDALILARMQFAADITFHILFPAIGIGLGWLLLFFRLRWLNTRNGPDKALAQGWPDAYRFWTKVFALSFALGVVSGITMSFQFGTTLSAFWILALNSWMQTPAGHEINENVYHVKSWIDVIFNLSFPYRFSHMVLASALTCAFLLSGLSAWQRLRGVAQA